MENVICTAIPGSNTGLCLRTVLLSSGSQPFIGVSKTCYLFVFPVSRGLDNPRCGGCQDGSAEGQASEEQQKRDEEEQRNSSFFSRFRVQG